MGEWSKNDLPLQPVTDIGQVNFVPRNWRKETWGSRQTNRLSRPQIQALKISFLDHYLRNPQEMTPVVTSKIEKESLLISSDNFRNTQIPQFILSWQVYLSIYIQVRGWPRLTTMTWYEACSYIIWKSDKTFWMFGVFLVWAKENSANCVKRKLMETMKGMKRS